LGSSSSLFHRLLNGRREAKVFYILSGEHPSLPRAEVKALLEACETSWRWAGEGLFHIRVEAPLRSCIEVANRAAMTMECCLELAASLAQLDEAVEAARSLDWSWLKGLSFAVRVDRKSARPSTPSSVELERAIGAVVKRRCPEARVDLKGPDVVIRGFIEGELLLLGVRLVKVDRGGFEERRPRRRPFFHPSALEPKLARLFVNLARARSGDVLLDPFAGTGSILIEASLLGCLPIGFDLDLRMAKGALRNLRSMELDAYVALGDARQIAIREVDCIATDPPYGRASSTHGLGCVELLEDFFTSALDVLARGGHICLAVPSWVEAEELASRAELSVVEQHGLRVHRSLTRKVLVLRRG